MINRISALLCSSLLPFQMLAQDAAAPANPLHSAEPATTAAARPAMTTFGLEDATPIKMRTARTISSAEAKVGDTVDFEVLEEVRVNGLLVVPKGGIAWATVTEAVHKRSMGREGKLNINIDSVRLADGEKVALRAVKEGHGGGHVGAMTGAIVATSIVFFPAAPLFLFIHGKDITIPKGTEITGYVNGNTPLVQAKFEEKPPADTTAGAPATQNTSLDISSTPAGADIEIDGKFVGDTPSTVPLPAGDHIIKISKSGFTAWQRTVSLSGGTIKLNPELEAIAK
ncbi:PEGA domain protein [Candidatus Koribacter versatilis Ellin345]|uniref:PEGA domain protein n=1 Tax=Koribacter versatilis (strain Ellin345) TaxID=204669 RepID=Q1II69_KORVE|nr:PEGA domain-containing protein [Candidatus Koribacter versatilis]ABF43431.1 PEGA domain protein [Candidatus Koribacter versatilis Ellin345]